MKNDETQWNQMKNEETLWKATKLNEKQWNYMKLGEHNEALWKNNEIKRKNKGTLWD